MTIDVRKYSQFLENVAIEIDIPPGKYQDAVDRYQAVGRWLEAGEYPGCQGELSICVQGSFRLGTVVRPIRNGIESRYDIDLVCEMPLRKDRTTPRAVKSMVGDRLREHDTYKRLLDPEGRRCWTLEYAEHDGVGFHLDVLPAVPDARSDRGFCVLMIDLDGLKRINDEAGHLRGDEVLRALGAIIAGSIRTVDSAYRYGGDEFVVLLPETDIVGAFFVAEKIRIGAEEVGTTQGTGESVTSVSIGLVSHPEDGSSAEHLIAAADRAMYEAKKLGKNQISGNPRPRPPLLARRSIVPVSEPGATAIPVGPAPEPEPIEADAPPVAADTAQEVAAQPMRTTAAAAPAPLNGGTSERSAPVVAESAAVAESEIDDDEADAGDVRRNIASASQSFDPDHQIRRAMDAFLSPLGPERERRTPDN
jgi:diguanylate cyclase (GGDEF)-like protein